MRLAFEALKLGGTASAILNAANEMAVQAFLDKKIGFMDIPRVIESVLTDASIESVSTIEIVIAADEAARRRSSEWMKTH